MGKTFQSGIISRLVVGGGTYAVLHNETQIDVDNSNGLPTIIKLQPIDPSLGQCTVYINDYGNNSSVGNITVVASAGNLINGQPTLVLDTDGIGAEISVSDQRNFIASLNNDSQSTGGLITADNGLTVFGTNVQLGGSLVLPTTIDALGSNTFSINDQAGLMFKTRDALGNFFFNNIGGTGTLVGSSQYIFSYLGDGGNVFTDSLIVINFGGANTFTNAVDFWNFGDYTQANTSSAIFNIGKFNHFNSVSSTTVIGYSNDLNACSSLSVYGTGNTVSGVNDKFIIGNNNNNLVIDGINGNVSVGIINADAKMHVFGSGGLTNVCLRLQPDQNSTEDTSGRTIITSDNMYQFMESFDIPYNGFSLIKSVVKCFKWGGGGVGAIGDANAYDITVFANNKAGVLSLSVVQNSFTSESIMGCDATYIVVGSTVQLVVKGTLNNNMSWYSITKKY